MKKPHCVQRSRTFSVHHQGRVYVTHLGLWKIKYDIFIQITTWIQFLSSHCVVGADKKLFLEDWICFSKIPLELLWLSLMQPTGCHDDHMQLWKWLTAATCVISFKLLFYVFFFLFYSRLSLDMFSGFRDGCELSIYSSIFQASSTSQDHIQGPFTFTPMVDHVRFTFSLSGMSLGCGTEPTHKLHTEINQWSPCCRGRCSTNIGHRGRHSPHLEISGGWAHSDVFF